jgi:hypothetical protein
VEDDFNPGDSFRARRRAAVSQYAALRAIDAVTGEKRWDFPYTAQSWAGVLSTASGLVFAGSSGNFMAFERADREEPVAFSNRIRAVRRTDHLHGRWPPVRPDALGHDADGVRAASVNDDG